MNTYGSRFDSSVEAGHTYVPDTLTPFTGRWRQEEGVDLPIFEPQSPYLQKVATIAKNFSANPILLTLLDDVVAHKKGDLSSVFLAELSVFEVFEAQDVYLESSYLNPAKKLVDAVRGASLPPDYRLSPDNRKVIIGTGKEKTKISLVGFSGIDDPEHPSCQILDAAWMLDRVQSVAPKAATILPEGFTAQQTQVAALAELIPAFSGTQVTSIFVDGRGSEAGRLEWPLQQ